MNSQFEECGHPREHADRWFKDEHRRGVRALYWDSKKQREINQLERMLEWSDTTLDVKPDIKFISHFGSGASRATEILFNELADQWRRETALLSSLTKKITHPAYLRIIALGPDVVPLILRRLRDQPAYWFVALNALSSEPSPVPESDSASFSASREAWLAWGRSKGLI